MAKLTEGNALYLYRLLRDELGCGRQTPLARVGEVLEADGIAPADVGCADVAELMGKLDSFIKLTTFKKGRVYATIVTDESLDNALEKAAGPDPAQKGAKNGKPWKRRRGGKAVRPTKPRHVEPKPEPEPEPEVSADPAPAASVDAEATTAAAEVQPEAVATAEAVAPEAASEPESSAKTLAEVLAEARAEEQAALAAVEKDGEAVGTSAAEAEPSPEPAAPEATPEPEPTPASADEPASAAEPEPAPAPEPAISLNITYDPYEGAGDGLDDVVEDTDDSARDRDVRVAAAKAAVQATDEPAAPAVVTEAPAPTAQVVPVQLQSDLPQSISDEVLCGDDLLNLLYRILPLDEDVMALLDGDWRVARSTGSLSGTRSKVTFPLRYLREDGSSPVEVTLRRSARPSAGKRWSLAYVDGDDGTGSTHEAAGIEGLPKADEGAWTDLSGARRPSSLAPNPARELAEFAVIGSWDTFLDALAAIAEPEPWDYPATGSDTPAHHAILREYVTVAFHRARREEKLRVADDGSLAAFDTGLLTPFAQDVLCAFEPRRGDIAWQFAGFCVAGAGELGERVATALDPLPEPPSYLRELSDVTPGAGSLVALDADAILDRQLGRLPRAFLAEATEGSEACSALLARAVEKCDPSAIAKLSKAVRADDACHDRLVRGLEDACAATMRRCRASYRVAIPAYDPSSDEMRLLIPLALVDDARADVALALEPRDGGDYRGVSLVSLPRAYACARTVSSEQPRWLSPEVALGAR